MQVNVYSILLFIVENNPRFFVECVLHLLLCVVMLWLVRIFIQNGLGLLATWLFVLVCFALGDVLLYIDSFSFFPAIELGKQFLLTSTPNQSA